MCADCWTESTAASLGTPAGRIASMVKPKSEKLFGLTMGVPRPVATSTFLSRGGQEGNGCWLTEAVLVVLVGSSDGSSPGNRIGQTNPFAMQRSCCRRYKGYGIALPAPLRHLSLTKYLPV